MPTQFSHPPEPPTSLSPCCTACLRSALVLIHQLISSLHLLDAWKSIFWDDTTRFAICNIQMELPLIAILVWIAAQAVQLIGQSA